MPFTCSWSVTRWFCDACPNLLGIASFLCNKQSAAWPRLCDCLRVPVPLVGCMSTLWCSSACEWNEPRATLGQVTELHPEATGHHPQSAWAPLGSPIPDHGHLWLQPRLGRASIAAAAGELQAETLQSGMASRGCYGHIYAGHVLAWPLH